MSLKISEGASQRPLIIGVASLLLLVILFLPLWNYWAALDSDRAELETRLKTLSANLDDQVKSQQLLADLRRQATIFPAAADLNRQTALLIQQVENAPGYSRLEVHRLEGMSVRSEEAYSRAGVSLQYSARLQDLHAFLRGLGAQQPAVKIERMTIGAHPTDSRWVAGQITLSGYAVAAEEKRG